MLLVRLGPDVLVAQKLLYLGKKGCFFVVMVRLDKLEPGKRVPYEVCLVCLLDMWSLLPNRVVAAEDAIVEEAHVRRARREHVCLQGWRDEDLAIETAKAKKAQISAVLGT